MRTTGFISGTIFNIGLLGLYRQSKGTTPSQIAAYEQRLRVLNGEIKKEFRNDFGNYLCKLSEFVCQPWKLDENDMEDWVLFPMEFPEFRNGSAYERGLRVMDELHKLVERDKAAWEVLIARIVRHLGKEGDLYERFMEHRDQPARR